MVEIKIVKTKQTPHHTDSTGRLSPLAPHRQPSKWGTVVRACVIKFEFGPHPHVDRSLDYRSKWKLLKYTLQYSTVLLMSKYTVQYSTVLLMFCQNGQNILYMYICCHTLRKGTSSSQLLEGRLIPQPVKGKRSVHHQPLHSTWKWKPGTQALRELRNLLHMTNLFISRLPFMW